jgi:hypothetical protein
MIEKKAFGKTGHLSTRTIFGGASMGRDGLSDAESEKTLELLLEYGINHLDLAASYGKGMAERRVGAWMNRIRNDIFLATKTGMRIYQEAKDEFYSSLERLQVDSVDLIQIHNLTGPDDWEMAMGPGGALDALIEIREEKLARFIGVTGHGMTVLHKMYDQARDTAKNWSSEISADKANDAVFCGVPFLLKDLIAECKGSPFVEGSKAVRGYISKLDTELVRRQKASGLIIVRKTNTPEFGALPTTEPALYGPTANPWDPSLTPGGSAAAVAAGIVPMAHGNDGGGSIRIPASCCGVFGLKPTRGRNPLGPLFGDIASGIVYEHALTRSARDSAALLDVTSGPDLGDPYYAPQRGESFTKVYSYQLRIVNRDLGIGIAKCENITNASKSWLFQASTKACRKSIETT